MGNSKLKVGNSVSEENHNKINIMKIFNKILLLFAAILLINNATQAQGLKGGKKKKIEQSPEKKNEKENEKKDDREHEKEDENEHEHKNGKKLNLSSNGEGCFDANTRILNIGLGFGGGNYYSAYRGFGYSYRVSPAFSLTYEQAYPKKLGPGYLGLGGYFGFQTSSSTYNYFYDNNNYKGNYYYKNSWKDFMIAARGAYHLDILNSKKAELYAGLLVGLRFQTYNYETNNPDPYAYDYRLRNSSVYPTYSIFVGGRWYFAKNVGIFAEVGYGISYLTGGVSFKF